MKIAAPLNDGIGLTVLFPQSTERMPDLQVCLRPPQRGSPERWERLGNGRSPRNL
jgi:hypothetical protein